MLFSARPALAALLLASSAFVEAKPCKSRPAQGVSTAVASTTASATTAVLVAATSASSTLISVAATSSPAVASSSSSSSAVAAASSSSSAAASTATATATTGLTADETSALAIQNSARAAVSETDLTWSTSLAANAQTWANHLASTYGSSGDLVHSSGTGEGENLYWQSDATTPYAKAATAWVDEKSLYSGEAIADDAAFETYGHYTQVIWDTTTEVGMAVASDGAGGYYVVARYNPPGNYIGETPTAATN